MTYSLLARDADTGRLGVAVQSHFFAVGALVPWGEAGVGVVATQSFVDAGYGPLALEGLRAGDGPDAVLDRLLAADPLPGARQVAVLGAAGRGAAHTGANCVGVADHLVVDGACAQANMMAADGVCAAMLAAFEGSTAPFPERLLAALDAAEALGGDMRGRQSAALLIVGPERSSRPWAAVEVDLRVDDDPEPLVALRRLAVHRGAYDRLGGALFEQGALLGDYTLTDAELEAQLTRLEEAQRLLGDNPEPTFWRGVLLARAGRSDAATAAFRDAARLRPALLEFARRLPAAGLLDHHAAPAATRTTDTQGAA